MQTNVKSGLLAARATLRRLSKSMPTVRVAADTGIHQSQVSRLFRGHFKRISPNVRALLDYAAKPRRQRSAAGDAAKATIIRAALRTWDSTPQGAQALVRLLKTVDQIRRLR